MEPRNMGISDPEVVEIGPAMFSVPKVCYEKCLLHLLIMRKTIAFIYVCNVVSSPSFTHNLAPKPNGWCHKSSEPRPNTSSSHHPSGTTKYTSTVIKYIGTYCGATRYLNTGSMTRIIVSYVIRNSIILELSTANEIYLHNYQIHWNIFWGLRYPFLNTGSMSR